MAGFPLSKTDKSLLGLPLSPVNRLAEFPLGAFNLLKMWMKFEFAAGRIKRNGSAIYHMGGNFCLVVRKIPGYDFSVYHLAHNFSVYVDLVYHLIQMGLCWHAAISPQFGMKFVRAISK